MPASPAIQVLRVDWAARSGDLLSVRRAVFVVEQGGAEEFGPHREMRFGFRRGDPVGSGSG